MGLTVNCVNLEGVNLTLIVNHCNGEIGAIQVELKDIFQEIFNFHSSIYTPMVHAANFPYEVLTC